VSDTQRNPYLQKILRESFVSEQRFRHPSQVYLLAHPCVLQCVCCSVLQCVELCRVAVCCSMLQCVALCCSVLLCVAVRCSMLQCVAGCCSVFQFVAMWCRVLQCVTLDNACTRVLQGVAMYCSVLQCVAVRYPACVHVNPVKYWPLIQTCPFTDTFAKSENIWAVR